MTSEKFCLRWNDFENNISCAFRELRDDKDFFDVTLACADDQIQAHKVIISACSPFFRNILRKNHHQHPLLYLKGVRYTDLQSVLNFMYHGEVNVAQDELNSFLAVAEDLQVKGLTQNQSTQQPKSKRDNQTTTKATPQPNIDHYQPQEFVTLPQQPQKHPQPPSYPPQYNQTQRYDEVQEIVPVKPEPLESLPAQVTPILTPESHQHQHYVPQPETQALATADDGMGGYQENYEDYGQYEGDYVGEEAVGPNKGDIADLLAKVTTEEGRVVWRCELCRKEFPYKSGGKRHIETMHCENTEYECEVCGRILKNKNTYQNHISITHGIKRRKAQ